MRRRSLTCESSRRFAFLSICSDPIRLGFDLTPWVLPQEVEALPLRQGGQPMEGEGDGHREAPEAQRDRQGPPGHATGEDSQDLRQSPW